MTPGQAQGPYKLAPRFVERIWGVQDLAPLFPKQDKTIGEVWFCCDDEHPLLVKFLFTSARLSVQVHPADDYAKVHENSRGKTEMWHIIEAEPGAVIALGFRSAVTPEQVRLAIADGTVEDLLSWVPAKAGDTFFAEAGVVHAIGGGLKLCEIQQNSDVTYRLYDYGRPRELHLEKGLAVSRFEAYEGRRDFPVHCDHFKTEFLSAAAGEQQTLGSDCLLIVLEGEGTLHGEAYRPGEVWSIPPVKCELQAQSPSRFLRSHC